MYENANAMGWKIIRTEQEYQQALSRLEEILAPHTGPHSEMNWTSCRS
jgi:hypothetical protein